MELFNAQCGCPLLTELTVENQDCLLNFVSTAGWCGFRYIVAQEEALEVSRCVHVDGTTNVTAVELVIESTVDNLIRSDLVIVSSRQ